MSISGVARCDSGCLVQAAKLVRNRLALGGHLVVKKICLERSLARSLNPLPFPPSGRLPCPSRDPCTWPSSWPTSDSVLGHGHSCLRHGQHHFDALHTGRSRHSSSSAAKDTKQVLGLGPARAPAATRASSCSRRATRTGIQPHTNTHWCSTTHPQFGRRSRCRSSHASGRHRSGASGRHRSGPSSCTSPGDHAPCKTGGGRPPAKKKKPEKNTPIGGPRAPRACPGARSASTR